MVVSMEMQCPPEGVPKDFQLPSRGRPMPKPPAGRNKEGRKGKRRSPQKRKRNENEKKHRKTTPHCDRENGRQAFGYMALPGWKAGWAATGLENGAAGCKKMVEVSLNF